MVQSGKSRDEIVKLIEKAKKIKESKEISKDWADYDLNEPFNPSDYPTFFQNSKKNIPPKINTDIGKIYNQSLNNKDELYNILIEHLQTYHPEYIKGENLDNILQHTLSYLQELNNNITLPTSFKKTIQRFIFQFKPTSFATKYTPLDIDIKLPNIHQQTQQVSEKLLEKHIKEIIKEYNDMLDILTPKYVIKLLEGLLYTNLDEYKSFIKQTIKNNLPQTPIQEKPLPKVQQINIDKIFNTIYPQENETHIEPKPSITNSVKKSKSVKRKSKKSKSVKRKSKKSKSKRKSVKKSKSKRKSVKKSKSKRKSVKKSKSNKV
jgi:hypothetical protein